jgi:glycosyltransferase involved in cell wall biosynthesis
MKILLISSFFPPLHTSGTEKRTLGYALCLQGLGHKVQVACAGKWEEGQAYWNGYVDEKYLGIPIRRVNLNWRLAADPNRFLYDNSTVEEYFGQWLSEWQPDIIHITSCLTLSASIIQAVKSQQLPVVLTLTDYWFICPKLSLVRSDGILCDGRTTNWDCLQCMLWNTKIYRGLSATLPEKSTAAILEWVSKRASINRLPGLRGMALDMAHRKSFLTSMINLVDCVTAPSSCLRDIMKASGITNQIKIVHSGHHLAWLETMPKKTLAEKIRIGYIGQIIPVKGVHILLSAFLSISISGQAQLSIYGDINKAPNYVEGLKSLAKGHDQSIKFCEAFPHEQLGEILAEIDILVVPSSWHENNPRVIQEAFASKTPVIASNVGGITEFVKHEVNGLVFERNDVDDLARQLQRILTETGLLERLSTAIEPVKTIEEEVMELQAIYTDLIAADRIATAPEGDSLHD